MRRASVLLALAASLVPGTAFAAAPEVRVDPAVAWPAREVVLSLPTRGALATGDVEVLEDGRPVTGLQVSPAAGRRATVLAIDASQSMRGRPIVQAMAAARRFADRRDPAAPLGVVFFSREARVALAPTTDQAKIAAVLAGPPVLTKGTRTYDAASAAMAALTRAGERSGSVVLLSDGADAGSRVTPAALREASRRSGARVFTVALRSNSGDDGSLGRIAAVTGGRAGSAARPSDLTPVFAAIGRRLSAEHLVSYSSVAQAGEAVRLEVRVRGLEPATASYRTPQLPADVRPLRATDPTAPFPVAPVLAVAAAVLLLALVLLRPRRRTLTERLSDFTEAGAVAPAPVASPLADAPSKAPSRRLEALAEQLDLAGIDRSAVAVRRLVVLATLVPFAGLVLSGRPWASLLALLIPLLARTRLQSRISARRREFGEQLPDNLQVMAAGLRAGHSMSAALAGVVSQAAEPARSELQRAVADQQLGVDLDRAIGDVARRMDCPDLDYVGIVARLQRDGGGSTADVLDTVVETVRGRQELQRKVRALTAQSRLGGGVVTVMPLGVVGVMSLMQPGYLNPMLERPGGVAALVVAALMLMSGWAVISRISRLEV